MREDARSPFADHEVRSQSLGERQEVRGMSMLICGELSVLGESLYTILSHCLEHAIARDAVAGLHDDQ